MTVLEAPVAQREDATVSLSRHRATFPPPSDSAGRGRALLAEVDAAGLRGCGGAGFPTARKLRAIASRNGIIVVNGTEGEPASRKDRMLLCTTPHRVIDGAVLAAHAVRSRQAHICVSRSVPEAAQALRLALAERQGEDGRVHVLVHEAPEHFVVGEETALVHWLNGGEALPTGRRVRMTERGVDGRPTAILNAETAANLAQIAARGAEWFRSTGTDDEPGTRLATVTRPDRSMQVVEVEVGVPLATVITAAGGFVDHDTPVLVGGYFGAWITGAEALAVDFSDAALRPLGASVGAGIVVPLPRPVCGWCETVRLLEWMVGESSRQCGVCVNGLPALASAADAVARGIDPYDNVARLHRWVGHIDHRGGCGLPDGAVRLLRSALRVHANLIGIHARSGGCPCDTGPFLAIPETRSNSWR